MPADIAKHWISRWEKLFARQAAWRTEWRQIAEFIVPRKLQVVAERSQGTPAPRTLFSSVAIKAAEDLAAAIHGTLTNASIRWFRLVFPVAELNREPEASEWLEAVADRMFVAFQQSNFDSEFSELYLDIGAFGTGVVFLDEAPPEQEAFGGLRFRAVNISECVISEDSFGRVDTVIRKLSMPRRAAAARWPHDSGRPGIVGLSETERRMLEANPDEHVELLHVVAPREDADASPDAPPNRRPWTDIYIELKSKHLVAEGGFFEFPYAVPRWSKNTGEEYGRGPGQVALPDVRTLNRARELKLQQWSKAINPPLGALDDSVIGQLRLTPGAVNYFREKDAVWPIESRTRFDVSAVNEAELVQSIRDIFFSDLISLPPIQGTPMSATEAAQRFELMERKLGPTIGRLKSELLQPVIRRAFGILLRAGQFPPVPEVVVSAFVERGMERGQVEVRYEGPLERAQRASDLAVVERTLALAQPILVIEPDARVVFDGAKLIRYVAEKSGLPEHLLRSEQEVEEARSQLAELAQVKEAASLAKTGGEALRAGGAGVADLANAALPEEEEVL